MDGVPEPRCEMGFGPHLVLDGYAHQGSTRLGDLELLYTALDELPDRIKMTKIMPPYVFRNGDPSQPESYGLSGFVLIAESHISLHTFPYRRFLNADIFSCHPFDVGQALRYLEETFELESYNHAILDRGTEFPKDLAGARAVTKKQRKRLQIPVVRPATA